ncbi:M23 family metallopeptidase [Micromonospora rifamycinica]|uniref:M23 family metallopeptidase n=1 Tax=Micromonospora rifamycinica TaxID=291594 RepID=UPI002E27E790|nr:M23 family metallopeptidase [Micromonospora rifamycinica]
MGRVAVWVMAGAAGLLLLLTAASAGVVSSVFGIGIGGGGGGGSCVGVVTGPDAAPAGLSAEQSGDAGLIVAVGERLPVRGRAAIGITTAHTGGTVSECDGVPISASGWTRPVAGTAGSGFRTGERPGHDGVDIMAAKGTVIRAASGGVVVRVRCNIGGDSWEPTGGPMPCDRDGYPGLGGCGWYTDIRHSGDITSRYCHMVREPVVVVGQTVTAGQPIGHVGSSGNSSGPHVHYEIREGRANALDPVSFMMQRGAAL